MHVLPNLYVFIVNSRSLEGKKVTQTLEGRGGGGGVNWTILLFLTQFI